jgi:hypothetical protein
MSARRYLVFSSGPSIATQGARMNGDDLAEFYEFCGMNAARVVTCWITAEGERGTTHTKPIFISIDGAISKELAGLYTPEEQPEEGGGICFFKIDHAAPDENQIIFDHGFAAIYPPRTTRAQRA